LPEKSPTGKVEPIGIVETYTINGRGHPSGCPGSRPVVDSSPLERVMRSLLLRVSLALAGVLLAASLPTAQTTAWPYDHVHLLVPDTAAGANWYEKNFGGKRITEAPDRLMYGSTRFMFIRAANAKPSTGSAIDHVGFSVPDIDAKFKE